EPIETSEDGADDFTLELADEEELRLGGEFAPDHQARIVPRGVVREDLAPEGIDPRLIAGLVGANDEIVLGHDTSARRLTTAGARRAGWGTARAAPGNTVSRAGSHRRTIPRPPHFSPSPLRVTHTPLDRQEPPTWKPTHTTSFSTSPTASRR